MSVVMWIKFTDRSYGKNQVTRSYIANFCQCYPPYERRAFKPCELFARHYFQKHLTPRGIVPRFADCWWARTGLSASPCLYYLHFHVDRFCKLQWLQSSENRPRPPVSLWFIGLQLDNSCVNQTAIFTTLPRQLRMNGVIELRNLCLEACGIMTNTKNCTFSLKILKFKKVFQCQTQNVISYSILSISVSPDKTQNFMSQLGRHLNGKCYLQIVYKSAVRLPV
jgi:hypothetical protein